MNARFGLSLKKNRWSKIERMQKHIMSSFLQLRATTPYEIMLAEIGLYSLDLGAMRMLILNIQRVAEMDDQQPPNKISK